MGLDLSNPAHLTGMKIAQLIGAVCSFILPAHLYAVLTTDDYKKYLQLITVPKINSLVLGALAILAGMPLINWMAELNSSLSLPAFLNGLENAMKEGEEQMKELTEAFLKMNNTADLGINLFIIGFIAAFSEELLFRGAIQKSLFEWTGNKHKAIWISAALFSFIHFQFYGFLPRMMMGAMLGYVYMWTGSIWVPVFTHFVNNGAAVLLSYYEQKNIIPKEIENIGSSSEEFTYVVISIILVTGLLWTLFLQQKKHHEG